MVCNRLGWYLGTQNLITETQAGFRKHQSTNQQIVKLRQYIKDKMDKKDSVLAVFVGFKGAYDSIPRLKLKFKQRHGGPPQGAVSSTTLFNIIKNDLPSKLKEVCVFQCQPTALLRA